MIAAVEKFRVVKGILGSRLLEGFWGFRVVEGFLGFDSWNNWFGFRFVEGFLGCTLVVDFFLGFDSWKAFWGVHPTWMRVCYAIKECSAHTPLSLQRRSFSSFFRSLVCCRNYQSVDVRTYVVCACRALMTLTAVC